MFGNVKEQEQPTPRDTAVFDTVTSTDARVWSPPPGTEMEGIHCRLNLFAPSQSIEQWNCPMTSYPAFGQLTLASMWMTAVVVVCDVTLATI